VLLDLLIDPNNFPAKPVRNIFMAASSMRARWDTDANARTANASIGRSLNGPYQISQKQIEVLRSVPVYEFCFRNQEALCGRHMRNLRGADAYSPY